MLFGRHYEKLGQGYSIYFSYCLLGCIWMFGYSIYSQEFVKLSKSLIFKTQEKDLCAMGIKVWCVGNTSLVTKLDNYLLKWQSFKDKKQEYSNFSFTLKLNDYHFMTAVPNLWLLSCLYMILSYHINRNFHW